MRQRLEYAAAWPFIKIMGILPRPLARAVGIGLAWLVYLVHVRLRQVGMRNLAMVFPEKSEAERARILRGEFASLGRQLAEVCHFPSTRWRMLTRSWCMTASRITSAPTLAARACCCLRGTL